MNYIGLGKQIRKYRTRKKLTIEQLSEKAGISSNFLGKIERAQSIPSLETIINIANALECGLDILLCNDLIIKKNNNIECNQYDIDLLCNNDKKTYYDLCQLLVSYFINKNSH